MAKNKTERDKLKKEVFAFYLKHRDIPFHKYHQIDKKFPVHHNTIKAYVEEMSNKKENQKLLEETYQEKIDEENRSVFEYLENDTELTIDTISILKKAIRSKGLKAADDAFTNIKDIASSYGIMIDKELALAKYRIDMQKLDIEKTKLSIKERELELRISHPEAFAVPNIIVDIEGGDKYATNDKVITRDSTSLS